MTKPLVEKDSIGNMNGFISWPSHRQRSFLKIMDRVSHHSIMIASSKGNIFRVTGPGSFDVFFDLRQNKRLNKQSRHHPAHYDATEMIIIFLNLSLGNAREKETSVVKIRSNFNSLSIYDHWYWFDTGLKDVISRMIHKCCFTWPAWNQQDHRLPSWLLSGSRFEHHIAFWNQVKSSLF